MEVWFAGKQQEFDMKLTAIMLILNSFFTSHQGVDVVGNFIQPIKQISTASPLSSSEFLQEAQAISSAATFCRDVELISMLDNALEELYSFYEDIDAFELKLNFINEKTGLDLAQVSNVLNEMLSSMKNDVLSKLGDFDAQVLKRSNNMDLLTDSRLLKEVANKSSRVFSELRTLVAQTSITHVVMTSSFINDEEISKLAKASEEHFMDMSA